jgi:16S rRNA (guanine(966)-N(2))-methyltransferase RsmD
MRIIAGEFRGRLLKTLRGREVRPTSDKLRETLFNVLRAEVSDSVFIDCYAGSGAVGLEAVSRGAKQVYLIEQSIAAARIIEQNIATLGVASRARLLRAEAGAALRKLEAQGVRADVCFLDPPYAALGEVSRNLGWLAYADLMLPTGVIVLEHSRKDKPLEQCGRWFRTRLLESGSSAFSLYRMHTD